MRIIIANYRYFIAGGPEKYMFKFMDAARKMGIEVIPFSVNNPQNEETPYVLKITGQISDSEEDQKIWKYIQENRLENKVVFTGFKHGKELEELISRSTCIVCPAIWYENMPNTVIEAYAYGKPVVASRVGSLAEIVEDGKTGCSIEKCE